MRKILSVGILALIFAVWVSGCQAQEADTQEASEAASVSDSGQEDRDSDEKETAGEPKTEEPKAEEPETEEPELRSMFHRKKDAAWEYIDSVPFSDGACGRVGAVLFWDSQKETTNVAFFDAEGDYQQCGTYAKTAAEPGFTYLGEGTVTFRLETEEGAIYSYTLTLSIDGGDVTFKAQDDLP